MFVHVFPLEATRATERIASIVFDQSVQSVFTDSGRLQAATTCLYKRRTEKYVTHAPANSELEVAARVENEVQPMTRRETWGRGRGGPRARSGAFSR